MASLVADLGKYFGVEDVNIDNLHFKVHYKVGAVLFLLGSVLLSLNQFVGDPINCDFEDGRPSARVASNFCWLHGSSYLPPEYQSHVGCVVDHKEMDGKDDAPDTSYYQWVAFALLLQAASFYLPYTLWSHLEGGLIASFGSDSRAPLAVSTADTAGLTATATLEASVDKFVAQFRAVFHRSRFYFLKFVCCELLAVVILYGNVFFTDKFLGGKFRTYGFDAVQYYRMAQGARKDALNPLCIVFPTEVSCTVPSIGGGGGKQTASGFCVLSQNALNQKFYLVLWWYFALAMTASAMFLLYRLATAILPALRSWVIVFVVGQGDDEDDDFRRNLSFLLERAHLSDWFVLVQLAGNTNPRVFRSAVNRLRGRDDGDDGARRDRAGDDEGQRD